MPTRFNHQHSGSKRDLELDFDPSKLQQPVTPYTDDLKDEYAETQNALKVLREQEEQIRRRAEELEEITQKEDRFIESQNETISQIEKYLSLLEREGGNAREIARECDTVQRVFLHHLSTLKNLHPDAHDRGDRNIELDHALKQIEAARMEVDDAMPLLEHLSGRHQKSAKHSHAAAPAARKVNQSNKTEHGSAPVLSSPAAEDPDFLYWLKAGIAFTLPVMTLAVIITIIVLYLR